jgi:adenosylcobinamide kinase / adenosylcobinamide-phosphate guanylyltransferase
MLSLIIGGARSGKSRFAQSLGASARTPIYLATARAEDEEMAARIARHRSDRPAHWATAEEPLAIASAVERHAAEHDFVLVDCLTLWLSNFAWQHRELSEEQLRAGATAEIARLAAAAGPSHVALVTNEVGCGIVPEAPVARSFRDLQGWVNQEAAGLSDWVYLVTAGIAVPIKRPGAC